MTAVRVRKPPPFSSEPITDAEAATMFGAVVRLLEIWGVTHDQASILLAISRRTFNRWKGGKIAGIGRDRKARLSNLMGIHEALRIMFTDAARGYAWIKAPNEVFDGASALDVMLRGDLTDLMRVRQYLDAECGGW